VTVISFIVSYVIPIFIIFVFVYATAKRKPAYSAFTKGAKEGFLTVFDVLPCIIAITVFLELFKASGMQSVLSDIFAPVLGLFGVPEELFELVLLRPFSGSAGTATFTKLIQEFGADSYPVRCASVIMGSSETVFYITAVYFSGLNLKKLGGVIPISLLCSVLSTIGACALCRII
jgi:spore maturation protein B